MWRGIPFGHPPADREAFFAQLRRLIDDLHAAGMAYVDLHKRENVIIDTEGRPHLIDFQVCVATGQRWPGNGRLMRFLVRKLQEMDDYHFRKHFARCMTDLLSPEEVRRLATPPGFIRAHRFLAVPLRTLRRRLLAALKVRAYSGRAETELEPEDAFRSPAARGSDLPGKLQNNSRSDLCSPTDQFRSSSR